MKRLSFAGAVALAVIAGVTAAQSAPVPDKAPEIIPASTYPGTSNPGTSAADNVSTSQHASAQYDWIDGIAGKTLTALDGSTLTLTLTEDGMSRHLVYPSGEKQDTGFTFINPNLGTLSDTSKVVGFFRRNGDGLDVTYEDGRSETITLTKDGGIAMVLHTSDNAVHCMNWYPDGHTFNDAEKRTALAQYAKRLGLPAPDPANMAPVDSCSTTAGVMQPIPDAPMASKPMLEPLTPPPAAKHHKKRTAELDTPGFVPVPSPMPSMAMAPIITASVTTTMTPAAPLPLSTISVRDSQVHPVSDDVRTASRDDGPGASDCLSVDSDGDHWGFRNRCRFDVEFSYCLKNSSTDIASCDNGPASGLVAANGFTPLLRASLLGGDDAEHHFRWVGCSLADGVLEARLEQTSPPAGRCIAPAASRRT